MKKLLLPISAIAGCSSITFAAGNTLGMKQIDSHTLQSSSTPATEKIVEQPQNDLEAACQEGNMKACEQIAIAKDLLEFQSRVQRITDRAKEEVTRLKNKSYFPIIEINQKEIQNINVESETEMTSRIQNMPTVLLTQIVTSSLQPIGAIKFQPIEALDFQPIGLRGYSNRDEGYQTSSIADEDSSVIESVEPDELEIR